MTADDLPRYPFTVPVPDPMEQMDAIRKRGGEGRRMRLPWPRDLPAEPSHVDQSILVKTWYRSLKDGKLWCEGRDPDEVAASGGDSLEVLRQYAVTSGWQPWDPGEIRREEIEKVTETEPPRYDGVFRRPAGS